MGKHIIQRKRGTLKRLIVEIDASQFQTFEDTVKKMGLTKSTAIQSAINVWLGMTGGK